MTEPLQIVGLGMATLDVLLRLQEMPTWEHGTRLSDFGFDGGGPVGTAMVAAARLGARVGFVGTAGNDVAAQLKMQSFITAGVDLSRVVYRDVPEDQVIIVHVNAETGERVFSGVHRPTDTQIRPAELDRAYITAADYLHLEGYHREAAMVAAQWMHTAGKRVMLDGSKTNGPVADSMRELVGHVDILISGSGFVQGLTGERDIWDACAAALDVGPSIVVQTEGDRGSYTVARATPFGDPALAGRPADLVDGLQRFHMPAFQCGVIDTTGAGDVFHGAYLVGLLHGWDLRQIARFATAVSALKCSRLGGRAGIPTYEDVMAYLAAQGV